jgi:zinc transport system ATP-binding protein
MEEQIIVSLRSIYAGYDDETILEDVNFDMFKGDFVGLIGPNGGGKTTLARVMLGLIKPSQGEITIMGQLPQAGRKQIGYIPQLIADDFDFPINVWEVVRMGRLGYGSLMRRFNAQDDAIVEEKLRWLGLLDVRKRAFKELSGGQRQRVHIARALATEPAILLLDEPTSSVDAEASQNLYELLKDLNQHVTILLISHDLTAVSRYVKTIGCINHRLVYHREKQLSMDMLAQGYGCPVDLIAHVYGHPDCAALVCDSPCNSLPNPPRCVGAEFVAASIFKFLGCSDQADIAFLDQIEKRDTPSHVFFGDTNHETAVCGD